MKNISKKNLSIIEITLTGGFTAATLLKFVIHTHVQIKQTPLTFTQQHAFLLKKC